MMTLKNFNLHARFLLTLAILVGLTQACSNEASLEQERHESNSSAEAGLTKIKSDAEIDAYVRAIYKTILKRNVQGEEHKEWKDLFKKVAASESDPKEGVAKARKVVAKGIVRSPEAQRRLAFDFMAIYLLPNESALNTYPMAEKIAPSMNNGSYMSLMSNALASAKTLAPFDRSCDEKSTGKDKLACYCQASVKLLYPAFVKRQPTQADIEAIALSETKPSCVNPPKTKFPGLVAAGIAYNDNEDPKDARVALGVTYAITRLALSDEGMNQLAKTMFFQRVLGRDPSTQDLYRFKYWFSQDLDGMIQEYLVLLLNSEEYLNSVK